MRLRLGHHLDSGHQVHVHVPHDLPVRAYLLLRVYPTYFFFHNWPLTTAQLNATSQLLYVRQREYVLLGAFWTMVCCPCPNPSPNLDPELVRTLSLTLTPSLPEGGHPVHRIPHDPPQEGAAAA